MSQPKRYSLKSDEWGREQSAMVESDDGGWIWHSDYAALAAENERLTAEVEWLRKADRLVCWNPKTEQWEIRHEAVR